MVPSIRNATDSFIVIKMLYVEQYVIAIALSMSMWLWCWSPHFFCYSPLPAAAGALAALAGAGPAQASRSTPIRKPPCCSWMLHFAFCMLMLDVFECSMLHFNCGFRMWSMDHELRNSKCKMHRERSCAEHGHVTSRPAPC